MNSNEKITYLGRKYGINLNEEYQLTFRSLQDVKNKDNKHLRVITDEILNFHPSRIVMKNENNFYIINGQQIVELLPSRFDEKYRISENL